jgi:TonB family protein
VTLPSKLIESLSARVVCAIALSWTQVALAGPKPLTLGQDYYPPESRRRHEEGVCVVKITVTAEGNVEGPTLTLSTGYSRLDNACLAGFRGQHMKPAIRDGKPATVTVEMPVVWKLASPGQVPIKVDPNNLPRIGRKYYPAESMRVHEEGLCVVKVRVSAYGDVQALSLTHSTGFLRLDQACLDAFNEGGLLPASVNGTAVDSTAEFPIAWRLGDSRPVDQ